MQLKEFWFQPHMAATLAVTIRSYFWLNPATVFYFTFHDQFLGFWIEIAIVNNDA